MPVPAVEKSEPAIEEIASPNRVVENDAEDVSEGLLIEERPRLQSATVVESNAIELPEVEVVIGDRVADVDELSIAANVQAPQSEPQQVTDTQVTNRAAAQVVDEPVIDVSAEGELLFVTGTILPIGPLKFVPGSATLDDTSRDDVEEVVNLLRVNPKLELIVEAHTAAVGNADLNMLLARRRALSVIRLLVDEGIVATRLRPEAFGDTAPIANNNEIDLNDRVELRVRQGG